MTGQVIGLVCCAAGGLDQVREGFVVPALDRGWRVPITVTPTAATWLDADGETARLAELTGFPVRSQRRLPSDVSPHPPVDCYVVAPASANTVARLALGLIDNQALAQVCEAIGSPTTPVVVFPRINAGQPAWDSHLAALRRVGVRLVYGPDAWPLYPPREGPTDRGLPWAEILATTEEILTPISTV